MKKKNAMPLLLILLLICTMLVSGTVINAENGGDSGMVINKTAIKTSDESDSYTIELEAYATGESIITEITQDVLTDIVLVLDQSGSMAWCIGCGEEIGNNSTHTIYIPTTLIENNGTYYIKDGNTYTQVYYCDGNDHVLGAPCSGGAGWYTSTYIWNHTPENKITPKTAENQDGTQFYEAVVEACSSRLNALINAVSNFADAVANKAKGEDGILGTADDVNHRIAVVGFASRSGSGNNTELLSINGNNSGSVGVAYNSITDQNLIDVLQDMDKANGQIMVSNAIGALAAQGATRVDLGMDMAQRILAANPDGENEERNRVVVVFTDGAPTSSNGFEKDIAESAILRADNIKGPKTTVYSVGVFAGADATSPGTEPSGDLGSNSPNLPAACNWFMQNLSSNNGTPQNPSYYLSAADADTLNSIFQQIANWIEEGGASTTLGAETIIKDIIAPAFTLPDGATADDITLETYACTGKEGDAFTWADTSNGNMGAQAVLSSTDPGDPTTTSNQVSVTGFDFCGNYVGPIIENDIITGYRGHKLVIKFTVTPRPGFLGGNGVATNTSAGVYEDEDATEPVMTFDAPTVDISIPNIIIETPSGEKNIYLLQGIPLTNIHEGVSVKIGTVSLDLNPDAVNWGLESWQNEYVGISVKYKDADGNPIPPGGLQNITGDTSYSVTVTIEPEYEGEVGEEGVTKEGNVSVNVFKPELTFNDIFVFYGDDAPTDTEYASAWDDTKWKHGDVLSTSVTMIGTAPQLVLTYTPEADKIEDGEVNTKQDIKVDVSVKIDTTDVTDHTTFLHTACVPPPPCSWDETTPDGSPAFLLHVNTCTLTIQKTGGAVDESYVFNVYKDGTKYSEVTIWGNSSETLYELPVGAYTIQEETDWSWRYTADYIYESESAANLTADSPNGSITCQNTKAKEYWLNGYSEVAKNVPPSEN